MRHRIAGLVGRDSEETSLPRLQPDVPETVLEDYVGRWTGSLYWNRPAKSSQLSLSHKSGLALSMGQVYV